MSLPPPFDSLRFLRSVVDVAAAPSSLRECLFGLDPSDPSVAYLEFILGLSTGRLEGV